jgi:hypothetical protein
MADDKPIDVEFSAPAVRSAATGGIMRFPSAEEMIGAHREFERYKAQVLGPKDYHPIDGRMVPTAAAAMRLSVAPQITFDIISKNEHGDIGVRRSIVQQLRYPLVVKKVRKKRNIWDQEQQKKVYRFVEEDQEQFDFDAEPRLIPRVLYTVTMRGRDAWGRSIDHEASFDAHELGFDVSDNTLRARCETRARSAVAVKLIGGVDAQIAEEVLGEVRAAAQAQAEALKRAPRMPSMAEILERAKLAGKCTDGASFVEWINREVPGCEECKVGTTISKDARSRIIAALDLAENQHAPSLSVHA